MSLEFVSTKRLAHQGPERWTFSCEFSDLFGTVPEPLRPYLPSFRHALVDLPRIDDRELSKQARLRAFLKALKYGRYRDLTDHMHVVLSEAPTLCKRDLLVILTYLDRGPAAINDTVVGETLDLLSPDRKERNIGWLVSYFQTHYDKAMEEGTARGMAEGKAQGEARVLARFLEKRFGIVPDAIREQIYAADISTIEAWFERAFDAPNLQSVFESN